MIVAVVGAMFAATVTAPPATAAEVTLYATDAGWTTTRSPQATQRINGLSVTHSEDRTYLKFDGRSLDAGVVTEATLVLTVRSTTVTQPGVVVYPTTTAWSSSTLTQANQPSTTAGPVSGASGLPRAGQELRIPLDVSAVSTTGGFGLRLQYTQKYIRLMLERRGIESPRIELKVAPSEATTPTGPPSTQTTGPTEGEPSTTPSPSTSPTTSSTWTTRPPQTPSPTPTTTRPTQTPTTRPTTEPTRPDDAPLVFAHYFTPYPLSLDNLASDADYYARNYLQPSGEGGKFASWGGLLRDRPLAVPTSRSSDWQVRNFMTEIEQAKSAGIDGWTLNLMSASGRNWDSALQIMEAAERVGDFVVVPMVDATATFADRTPEAVAAQLAQLYAYSSAYKEDREYLLSSFKAEGNSVSWWKQLISTLEGKYRIPITFQAVFLDASAANMQAFAPIADGFGNWGSRSVQRTLALPDYDQRAQTFGRTWMEAVAVQDIRYKDGRWAEALNTTSYRTQWERAISQDVDYVQLVTWNDYSESTQIAPSMAHGTAFLDITAYYTSWFHTGKRPAISSDEVVLTHRTQFVDAKPTYRHNLMGEPNLGGNTTPARDSVEALVWLTAPATVEVTVGGKTTRFSAPAGMSAYTVPLALGNVSVKIVRGGSTVQSLTSPFKVIDRPYVQDLQYWAASSW